MTYPKTIDNGAGERLTFEKLVEEDGVPKLIVSNHVDPGKGPIMHVHFKQDEHLDVVKGRLGYQLLGEEPHYLVTGQGITFYRNQYHRFWNDGDTPLICKGWVKPAHNLEYFLTEIYRSAREHGGEQPGTFDSAWLMHRYRSEFDMHGLPGFVRKVIFPLSRTVGNLTGKSKRFRDAPEPVL